jgi:serine/threonine protein phosphatase PrpC
MNRAESPDAQLYCDCDMTEPVAAPVAGGLACVFSARCPGKETANEDAAAVIPFNDAAAVLVVADGLGGSAAGEQASRMAVRSVCTAIQEIRGTDTLLRTGILNGIELANNVVQELSIGAATTFAAIEIDGDTIRPYHVGDSMILVVGGRGKIKLQTVPHSPVGYGVEAGLLDEAEAMHHEERHVVSNFIGTPGMHIEIGPPIQLSPRDTVLLASDGLFDNLHCDEIAAVIRKGNLQSTATQLAATSTERMKHPANNLPSKPDDMTFVTFRFSSQRARLQHS